MAFAGFCADPVVEPVVVGVSLVRLRALEIGDGALTAVRAARMRGGNSGADEDSVD